MSKIKTAVVGSLCGAVNGLFGSGGGMIAVPMLKSEFSDKDDENNTKKAHAGALAITLPLSIVSLAFYTAHGSLDMKYALRFIPGGIVGAAVGAVFLKKISSGALTKLFAAVMIYFGIKMVMR